MLFGGIGQHTNVFCWKRWHKLQHSIVEWNEWNAHSFFHPLSFRHMHCTYGQHQSGRKPSTICLREKNSVLCIYWSEAMRRYTRKLFKNIALARWVGRGRGREIIAVPHFSAHMLCKHMKRTNNCRYRPHCDRHRCRRHRFQVAGCENNCSIFIMQHTNSHSFTLVSSRKQKKRWRRSFYTCLRNFCAFHCLLKWFRHYCCSCCSRSVIVSLMLERVLVGRQRAPQFHTN